MVIYNRLNQLIKQDKRTKFLLVARNINLSHLHPQKIVHTGTNSQNIYKNSKFPCKITQYNAQLKKKQQKHVYITIFQQQQYKNPCIKSLVHIITNIQNMTQKRQRKQQQQIRLRLQRERQLLQQHKDTMMPLVKFLKKQGLPFKYAREGQNRIQYFRADDLNKFMQMDKVKSKIEGNQKVKSLVSKLQTEQCLLYYRRPADIKNLKYPPVLQRVHPSDPQARFCSFKFDTTISRKGLMFGILAGALALVLFPVWPFTVKYAIWLISLYLLIFLVGLLLFRLVVYMVCVVLGYNVWILPNLLGDYGFFQSFKPLIYAERWEKSWFNIAIRLGAFGLLTFYGVQLYLDPSFLQSHFTVTKSTIDDIHDWGVSKIKNQVKFSQRAITNLEDILNQTADVEDDANTHAAGQKDGSETEQNVQKQEEVDGQQSAQAQAQVQIEAQQTQVERQEQL